MRDDVRNKAIELFGHWSREIRRLECQIREDGYGLRGERDLIGPRVNEYCDEELWQAYDAIEPWLKPLTQLQLYLVPEYVPHMCNFDASTAHLALTSFLDPPERLLCAVDALRSQEYLMVKRLVRIECETLKITPTVSRDTVRPRRKEKEQKLLQRARWALIAHHMPSPDKYVHEPIGQEQLGKELGCSQETVSRLVNKLFPAGWKRGYLAPLKDGNIPKGILLRYQDGTHGVEAIDRRSIKESEIED